MPKEAQFVVEHPYGSSYIDGLKEAAQQLVYHTLDDQFLDGSDAGGVFISKNAGSIARVKKDMADCIKSINNTLVGDVDDYFTLTVV